MPAILLTTVSAMVVLPSGVTSALCRVREDWLVEATVVEACSVMVTSLADAWLLAQGWSPRRRIRHVSPGVICVTPLRMRCPARHRTLRGMNDQGVPDE